MYIRILAIVALAICLYSCSSGQDEPFVPESNKGIAFGGNNGTWQDAPTTRATSGLETLFKTFCVWGYKTTATTVPASPQLVMDGYKVEFTEGTTGSTATNTTGWEYVGINNPNLSSSQTIKYWDYSATSYRFFGYSPFEAKATTTESATGTTSENKSISFPFAYSDKATATSIPYISELWYGDNTATTALYGKCVTMKFSPLIAKVRFKFSYPANTKNIIINDINFRDSRFINTPSAADTPLKGIITATYPLTGTPASNTPQFAWVTSADVDAKGFLVFDTPYEEATDDIHILSDASKYGKWYYVPPFNIVASNNDQTKPYQQGAYTITANIDGRYASATVPAEYMQWKAGYQYTYIFKITEAGTVISFSDLQVEKWLTGSNIDNNGSGTEDW